MTRIEILEKIDKLQEIKDEMEELVSKIKEILRGTDKEDHAKAYWLGQMEEALQNRNRYNSSLGRLIATWADECDDEETSDKE